MKPKTQPIRTAIDLQRQWSVMMEPLGFSEVALWLAFISGDGEMNGAIQNIGPLPRVPNQQMLDGLMHICAQVLADFGADSSVAILVSRPGSGGVSQADRAWARGLKAAAEAAGVRLQPIHLATDERVVGFAPEDLA